MFTNDQTSILRFEDFEANLTRSLDNLSLNLEFSYLKISRWILLPIWKISIRWTIARSRWESQERESRGTTRYVIIWSCSTSNVFSIVIWKKTYKITVNFCVTRKAILFPKLWEKLLKFDDEGREFANILRSLEQFIQIVKSQYNFWKQNACLTCSWRFHWSNTSEQF